MKRWSDFAAGAAVLGVLAFGAGCNSENAATQCTDTSCGDHSTCDDSTGDIYCHCEIGYTGPRCELCDTGYKDDAAASSWLTPAPPTPPAPHSTASA